MSVERRLAELGITLPQAPPVAAAYVPWVRSGDLLFTAGQVAAQDGALLATGKLGAEVDLPTGRACARQCALNLLSQVRVALGDLDRANRIVKLTVFVASAPEFTQQHLVADGASELITDVFGDAGAHARSAVGAPSLPTDTPVEVEAIIEVG